MSSELIESLLKKYSKADLALLSYAFQCVGKAITRLANDYRNQTSKGLKDLRRRPDELEIDPRLIEEIEQPGFEAGFRAGYLFGCGVILNDTEASQNFMDAAIKEGISRG